MTVLVYDAGVYDTDVYGDNVPPNVTGIGARPPLELHAELVAPDGTRYRWAGDRTDPGDIPSGISFASKRYEGFERGSCQLNRPIDRDYPDLGLFDSFNLIGYDGSVAYEGMLGQVPRSTPFGIGVETTGWMAHSRHRKFREVYVDRDTSRWHGTPQSRRVALAATEVLDADYSAEGKSDGSLHFEGQVNKSIPGPGSSAELHYEMPPGLVAAKFAYKAAEVNTFAVEAATLFVDDSEDVNSVVDTRTLTADGTARTDTFTTPGRYLMLRARSTATNTPGGTSQFRRTFQQAAVYGSHGLTGRAISGEPDGFYVSDMIVDIASRFCPRLNPSGVQGTTWPVPQAAWHDRTDPYDAWLDLNKYHLWELAVWENQKLWYEPGDLTDYDWEVRTTDPGVSIELQGDSTDHLANFAVVQFQNVRTGQQDEVSPDTHPELRDLSVENPANRNGLDVEFGITLSDPTDPDSAAQIGRAALAENNQPQAIGTITVRGHVRDRAGHWQPGWKVRATDTVAITDWPNNRPRLIGEVEWDHGTKTGRIAVDSTLRRVDAFLDRYGTALRAAGLSG